MLRLICRHGIKDFENEKPKKKEKIHLKETISPIKQFQVESGHQKLSHDSHSLINTYDLLKLQQGVTYIENGIIKNSTTNTCNLASITKSSNNLISSFGQNPRLSKNEYHQLIQNMSPSKTQLITTKLKANENNKPQLENQINSSTKTSLKIQNTVKPKEVGVEIYYNPCYIDTLLEGKDVHGLHGSSPETYNESLKIHTKQMEHELPQRSPVDTFNMELLVSKDWGKKTTPRSITSLPKLPRLNTQVEQTMGIRTKYPRHRTNHAPLIKDYSQLLIAALKNRQIS